MRRATREALVDELSAHDALVEVGIGCRPDLARALAETGVSVTATDVRERAVPPGVRFVRDDVTAPTRSVYADASAIVARNLPAELQLPTIRLARTVGAACAFTTLGAEAPIVPVTPTSLPGDTLYRAAGPP